MVLKAAIVICKAKLMGLLFDPILSFVVIDLDAERDAVHKCVYVHVHWLRNGNTEDNQLLY